MNLKEGNRKLCCFGLGPLRIRTTITIPDPLSIECLRSLSSTFVTIPLVCILHVVTVAILLCTPLATCASFAGGSSCDWLDLKFCIIFTMPVLVIRSKLPVDVFNFVVNPSRITCSRFVNTDRHKNASFSEICFWIRFRTWSRSRKRLSAISSSFSELCFRRNIRDSSLDAFLKWALGKMVNSSSPSHNDCFCLMSLGRERSPAVAPDVPPPTLPGTAVDDDAVGGTFSSRWAPRLGTLDRDRTMIWGGGGFRMLPRLRLFKLADSGGSDMSSKSSRRRNSIGRFCTSS